MTPQHLQLSDAYHEQLLAARLASLQGACWGVLSAELDLHALGKGSVQLLRFSGVMPDGTPLDLSEGSPELPPVRTLGDVFSPTMRAVSVHLALPMERAGIDNYAEGLASPTRYRVSLQRVYDLAGGDEVEEIPTTQYAPLILLGNELRENVVSIPLFELVRDDAGALAVSESYVPPCLRIDASSYLMAALRRLLQAMVIRRRALTEYRRQRNDTEVEFRAEEITSFLLLNAINTYLPTVQHLRSSGDAHPRTLFLTLIQLVGQLATFRSDLDPSSLPEFNFLDLRSSFEQVFAHLTAMLSAEVDERFVALELEPDGEGMYRGNLIDEGKLFECERFLLAIQTDLPEQQVEVRLPLLAKVASWADVQGILQDALPGAAVEVTHRPPPEIPIRNGTLYFNIDTGNTFWRNVMADRQLAVYLPPLFDPSQTTVQLFGLEGPAASS